MFGGTIIGEGGAKRDKHYSGVVGNSAEFQSGSLSVTNTRIRSTLANTVLLTYGPYHPIG